MRGHNAGRSRFDSLVAALHSNPERRALRRWALADAEPDERALARAPRPAPEPAEPTRVETGAGGGGLGDGGGDGFEAYVVRKRPLARLSRAQQQRILEAPSGEEAERELQTRVGRAQWRAR